MKSMKHSPLKLMVTVILFCTSLFAVFSSCKKGDTGPQGKPGTANVIYSNWASAVATSFKDSIIDNSNLKIARVNAPELVDSIINKGTLLVYCMFGSTIEPLPYTSFAGGKINTIAFLPTSKSIVITRFTHDNTNSINLSSSLQYRYIIIPGGVVSGGRMAKSDYKSMTYEEVCKELGIPQ